LPPSCNSPHKSKQDCHDQESDEDHAMSGNEGPNSHDPEDQGSEDTQPSEEIKQRKVQVLQEFVLSRDWELIFTHVLYRPPSISIKSVISRAIPAPFQPNVVSKHPSLFTSLLARLTWCAILDSNSVGWCGRDGAGRNRHGRDGAEAGHRGHRRRTGRDVGAVISSWG
jgi:hypothetical protein